MEKHTHIRRILGLIVLAMCVLPAHAELVVIVNADSGVEHLSREEIVNIFMGRYRKLPDGTAAQPLDIGGESPEHRDFYKKLLDKSPADINAYWARLVFSGRIMPPRALQSQDEVLERVAEYPGAVGYIERKNLNNRVKVVYTLPE